MIQNDGAERGGEFCGTEGGGCISTGGKVLYQRIELVEKVGRGMRLVAHGTAGHGSMPRMDNAIMHLGGAVWKIGQWQPPMNLTDVTRTYFEKLAQVAPPEDASRYKALFDSSKTEHAQEDF